MTYPKVSTTGDHTGEAFGVPASPRLPEVEEAVLAHWAADDTFRASVEQRDPGSAARTSSSSTTARPSPTGCRTTATC